MRRFNLHGVRACALRVRACACACVRVRGCACVWCVHMRQPGSQDSNASDRVTRSSPKKGFNSKITSAPLTATNPGGKKSPSQATEPQLPSGKSDSDVPPTKADSKVPPPKADSTDSDAVRLLIINLIIYVAAPFCTAIRPFNHISYYYEVVSDNRCVLP